MHKILKNIIKTSMSLMLILSPFMSKITVFADTPTEETSYEVTIPTSVEIDDDNDSFTLSSSIDQKHILNVKVNSTNSFNLKCNDIDTIAYSLFHNDSQEPIENDYTFEIDNFTKEVGEYADKFSVSIDGHPKNAGKYSDTLTFTFEVESAIVDFQINDVTYQMDRGMTWGEWVDSEYNTDGYELYVNEKGDEYVIQQLNEFQINGKTYQMDVGMTWSEWIASAYNTDHYELYTNENGDKYIVQQLNEFQINGKTYHMDIGMTWNDWINSTYNTDGYELYTNENGDDYIVQQLTEFKINGVTYQMNKGMTWGEWVASEYNTDGYRLYTNENGDEYLISPEEFPRPMLMMKKAMPIKSDISGITDDTLIHLADGTQKQISELTDEDEIMVFNHNTGEKETSTINQIEKYEGEYADVMELIFSDETKLSIINECMLFDITENKYISINIDNYVDYIGHEFAKLDEEGIKPITLNEVNIESKTVDIYRLQLNNCIDYFSNSLLSSYEESNELLNLFEFDENLKYKENPDDENLDIETEETILDVAENKSETTDEEQLEAAQELANLSTPESISKDENSEESNGTENDSKQNDESPIENQEENQQEINAKQNEESQEQTQGGE